MTAKPGRRPRAPPKEEATFDTELQRYVVPSERVTMPKHGKSYAECSTEARTFNL
jgi:hypothetical protein